MTNDNLTTDYKDIKHEEINYVDDSTNIITTNDHNTIQNYKDSRLMQTKVKYLLYADQ